MVFSNGSHFIYLREKLHAKHGGRGIKAKFAKYLGVQPAFLSQVLSEKYCLSLEQADLANQYFEHTQEESEFFLLLVSRDRSGTTSLRRHFQVQIDAALKRRQLVVDRLGRKTDLSAEAQGIYYSSWIYSALHIGCTVPAFRTRSHLAEQFGLPVDLVAKVLEFLCEHNLLKKVDDGYLPTQTWVRIDKQSPQIIKHHSNWRQKAIQNLETQTDQDLHYSGVFSMDEKTRDKLKDRFLDFLKLQLTEVEGAKEDNVYVMGIDLFRLNRGS